jgi:hypothetical protein
LIAVESGRSSTIPALGDFSPNYRLMKVGSMAQWVTLWEATFPWSWCTLYDTMVYGYFVLGRRDLLYSILISMDMGHIVGVNVRGVGACYIDTRIH